MNPEKRYQVFMSSTFRDLIEERQAALQAVLELDHMPAGMELFPATDDSTWQLIKDVIDASDYYVVIVGGRYGSLDATGLGYTEREYDYAVSCGKPVIPLLHQNPDEIPRGKTEENGAGWDKLKAFRQKVEDAHTCSYWASKQELKAQLIVGLTKTTKRNPATGWIRADQVPSDATVTDLLFLQRRVSELETELQRAGTTRPPGAEHLQQGNETFAVRFSFEATDLRRGQRAKYDGVHGATWNDIFGGVAPVLLREVSEDRLKAELKSHLDSLNRRDLYS